MATDLSFSEGYVEALAGLLGEYGSGADIPRVLHDRLLCFDLFWERER